MITKEERDQLEKIPCTLKDGGFFQYMSENKKGEVKLKCPVCAKSGITNVITATIGKKKNEK